MQFPHSTALLLQAHMQVLTCWTVRCHTMMPKWVAVVGPRVVFWQRRKAMILFL